MSHGWTPEQAQQVATYEQAEASGQRLNDIDRGTLDALRYSARGIAEERRLELLVERAKWWARSAS